MNHDLSTLSLVELYDNLSECTSTYSKAMLNGLPDKEFKELRSLIEALQTEIAKRKKDSSDSFDDSQTLYPPHHSASA
jgi:hypothetical protein